MKVLRDCVVIVISPCFLSISIWPYGGRLYVYSAFFFFCPRTSIGEMTKEGRCGGKANARKGGNGIKI